MPRTLAGDECWFCINLADKIWKNHQSLGVMMMFRFFESGLFVKWRILKKMKNAFSCFFFHHQSEISVRIFQIHHFEISRLCSRAKFFSLWGSDCALHRQTIECCSHELALVLLFCVWIVQFWNFYPVHLYSISICDTSDWMTILMIFIDFSWPSRLTSKLFNQNQLTTCVVFFL